MHKKPKKKPRNGLKTIWWNPQFVDKAILGVKEIPLCPTTAKGVPSKMITRQEAGRIYRKEIKEGNLAFHDDSFVCYYEDDYKFDSTRGIWFCPEKEMEVLKHFKGIITPDFSTYSDFPLPLRLWNTYRMRAFGYWASERGLEVINNVRGKYPDDLLFCFEGIETNSIVCVGTVASGLKEKENWEPFKLWLNAMVEALKPRIILVYGSANYPFFVELKKRGIQIVSYEASTSKFWRGRKSHE